MKYIAYIYQHSNCYVAYMQYVFFTCDYFDYVITGAITNYVSHCDVLSYPILTEPIFEGVNQISWHIITTTALYLFALEHVMSLPHS